MTLPAPLGELTWYALAAVPLLVLMAYTVFGATGFGSSIVAVPLLAHLFPLSFSVAMVTMLDVYAATSTSVRQRRAIDVPTLKRMLPTALVGIAAGATLLASLRNDAALVALGLFVSLYGTYVLAGPRTLRRAPNWLAWPIGLIGGVFSALFGTGGPVYMVFFSARIADKTALRATSAAMVTVSVWLRLLAFVGTGVLLQPALLGFAAAMFPLMLIGLALGHRLHDRLSSHGVLRLIAVLLVANGLYLIVRPAA